VVKDSKRVSARLRDAANLETAVCGGDGCWAAGGVVAAWPALNRACRRGVDVDVDVVHAHVAVAAAMRLSAIGSTVLF
jgi:hypothetical protein